MSIRHINFFMIGALILLTVSLAFTVSWGLGQLHKTAMATERYYQLRSKANDDILSAIDAYLVSGDSLVLSNAEAAVAEFVSRDAVVLSQSLSAQVLPIAKDLQQRLGADLRAAGKQSGNNTVLLEQAEIEMMAVLDSLSDYAASSNQLAKRVPYFSLSGQLSRAVAELGRSRSKLFASLDQSLMVDVESKLERITVLVEQLSALEALGVYVEEESDDMEDLLWGNDDADDVPTEEQGDMLKQELSSLSKRYPQELKRTQELMQKGAAARSSVSKQMNLLQQKLASLEMDVLAKRASIEQRVNIIMTVLSLVMVVLAIAVFSLQHWIAGLIAKVNIFMAELADGDFRARNIERSRIAELEGLINSYQVLQRSLNNMIGDISGRSKDIQSASNRVTDSASLICQFTNDQRQQAERASGAVIEVFDSVRHVAEQTASVSAVTKEAGTILSHGQQKISLSLSNIEALNVVINKTGTALSTLQAHAQSINGFVEVIQSIAELGIKCSY